MKFFLLFFLTEFLSCALCTVRLTNGRTRYEGRVEILHDKIWGTVCDTNWNNLNAKIVCKSLGFRNGIAVNGSVFGGFRNYKIWMDNVACTNTKTSLSECSHMGWGVTNASCDHDHNAGVYCEHSVRLRGGKTEYEGRVEVLVGQAWGTICDDGWDDKDASVVCQTLRYGVQAQAFSRATFGPGDSQQRIVMSDVDCDGTEESVLSCPKLPSGKTSCLHSEDAGVRCTNTLPLRLQNGQNGREGRIEVYHSGAWGTICDDGWDDVDATVVCRILGFGSKGYAVIQADTGKGQGTIWMGTVGCKGTEVDFAQCPFAGWGNHFCGHQEDAGVRCIDHTSAATQPMDGMRVMAWCLIAFVFYWILQIKKY